VNRKVHDIAERIIAEAGSLIDGYTGPADLSAYRSTSEAGGERAASRPFGPAYDLANTVMGMFRRDERTELDRQLIEARHLLNVAKELGSDSVTLNDRLSRAEQQRFEGNLAESTRITTEVTKFAKSLIHEELNRQTAQLDKAINASRKGRSGGVAGGAHVRGVGAGREQGDLLNGYSLSAGRGQLERLTAVHNRIYERIVEISALIKEAEAQHLDASKQSQMLPFQEAVRGWQVREALRPSPRPSWRRRAGGPSWRAEEGAGGADLINVAKRMGFEVGAPRSA
jgi:hypothetical protein